MANPAPGPHGETLASHEHRKQRIGGLRFRSDHAPEALAESAVRAAGARNPVGIAIGLTGVRRRMRGSIGPGRGGAHLVHRS